MGQGRDTLQQGWLGKHTTAGLHKVLGSFHRAKPRILQCNPCNCIVAAGQQTACNAWSAMQVFIELAAY
jgi:hypothetical protein